MKKFMIALLGLSLLTGVVAFGDDHKEGEKKEKKAKKKGDKKEEKKEH
jgi:hypothetical protein